MNCPVCKGNALGYVELEKDLSAYGCGQCNGRWIGSFHYWKWKEASGRSLETMGILKSPDSDNTKAMTDKQPPDTPDLKVTDHPEAKLCPECGHFLRRFPVGHEISFSLDRCGNCGGMWFDQNEWEVLHSRGLHDDVHKIFSEIWQRQIRSEEHQKQMEDFYKQAFGEEGYQKALDLRMWLRSHPKRNELLAFLQEGSD